MSLCPPIFKRDGAALNPTEFTQSLHKRFEARAIERTRIGAQIANGRQPARLLCAGRERPADGWASNYLMKSRCRIAFPEAKTMPSVGLHLSREMRPAK